jgi:Na+/phosphate symporter
VGGKRIMDKFMRALTTALIVSALLAVIVIVLTSTTVIVMTLIAGLKGEIPWY